MSKLGSLYIQLGEPEGELAGCCETAEWAADYIEFLCQKLASRDAEVDGLHEQVRMLRDVVIEGQKLLKEVRMSSAIWYGRLMNKTIENSEEALAATEPKA